MVSWEAKLEQSRGGGEGEREGWAPANLEKARQNVRDKKDNVQRLERSVRWLEECVGRDRKGKEGVVHEVVEVELEEMMEEMLKEKVEDKVVEEKVTGAGGGGGED